MNKYEMICCVIDHGKGSKVLKKARGYGVKGGTIYIAKGTARSKLLDLLDLNEVRKEIVWMISDKEKTTDVIQGVGKEMLLHKPGHGIMFSMPLNSCIGSQYEDHQIAKDNKEGYHMHNAIFVVVEKGRGEEVIDLAKEAGARGATIWNARGSGIHKTEVVFAMPIEPEKEVVMIISEISMIEKISTHIHEQLHLDKEGNGILFTIPVSQTFGLVQ